ncbi:hypothetical protein ACF06X_34065 [Streptomyces sp. NPDC015346]|uniref:hypothetical protein n=1 Tax=Streptomyces sp. NPDC015346 TaxID=3364954 RepID=UPI0036F804B4
MAHVRNEVFIAWMARNDWTALELAKALNAVIRDVTQKTSVRGELSEVTVRKWRSGETTWPQAKARMALEQVSGRSAADLGFVPPDRRKSRAAPEDPLRRRTFFTVASAAGAVVLSGAAPSVGSGDVLRLRQQLDTVNALDDQRGGHDRSRRPRSPARRRPSLFRGGQPPSAPGRGCSRSPPTSPPPRPGRVLMPVSALGPASTWTGLCTWPVSRRTRPSP